MKILLTGMNSGHIREYSRANQVTTAGVLAQTLRDRGHTVSVLPFVVGDVNEHNWTRSYDHAIVGLSPLRGLGSAYMYGALAAVQLFGDDISTYLSEGDDGQTGRDLHTMSQNPKTLVDPFFHYKRGWLDARGRDVFPLMVDSVRKLAARHDGPDAPLVLSTDTLPEAFSALDRSITSTDKASNG